MAATRTDRRTILAISAAADCDPRTTRRHLDGGRVHPAIARAIDLARNAVDRVSARDGDEEEAS